MLSGEDFGYLKNEEQNKLTIIVKKSLLLGSVLFSISCFIYITMSAYYFVYHDKDSNIKVIKSPPEPIKIIEQGNDVAVKDIDKTIYDNIVGNSRLAKENLDNVRVIEQAKTPVVQKNNADLVRNDLSDNRVGAKPKISNSAIVVVENQTKENPFKPVESNSGEIFAHNNKQDQETNNNKVNDASLVSKNKPTTTAKSISRVQIAALASKDSATGYWLKLKKSHSSLFTNLNYFVSETNASSKGKFYRLQIGNFRNQIEAENFCRKFISQLGKSKANCIIVE